MARLLCCCAALMIAVMSAISVSAKVQCSCPTISADGEGNTSCSASESDGRCTIDFNLFGKESETRAAELLRNLGRKGLTIPNPTLSPSQSLTTLSKSREQELVDAVLIYMTVAAGNQYARLPQSVPVDSLKELVDAACSDDLKKRIYGAFNQNALQQWWGCSDEDLRNRQIRSETVGGAIVSPGCIEFTTSNGLWIMFKTNWSPARIFPRCGSPTR